jgi:hypothetical protein
LNQSNPMGDTIMPNNITVSSAEILAYIQARGLEVNAENMAEAATRIHANKAAANAPAYTDTTRVLEILATRYEAEKADLKRDTITAATRTDSGAVLIQLPSIKLDAQTGRGGQKREIGFYLPQEKAKATITRIKLGLERALVELAIVEKAVDESATSAI